MQLLSDAIRIRALTSTEDPFLWYGGKHKLIIRSINGAGENLIAGFVCLSAHTAV